MMVVGLSRTMTMDLAPVVMVGLVGDVGMQVDKRRRCRSNGERQAEQPDKQTDTPMLHGMASLCGTLLRPSRQLHRLQNGLRRPLNIHLGC